MKFILTMAFIGILGLAACSPQVEPVETAVEASGLPRLVDLGAESCVPCRMMQPELENLRTTMEGSLEVVFIDVNNDRNAASRYRIRVIPTQIFYSPEGVELARHEGYIDAEGMLRIFREHGYLTDDDGV
jgi:thioredoxin 1